MLPAARKSFEIGELLRFVERLTQRQVEDLSIHDREDRLVVTGHSPTYYVKQLVTQAIMSCAPKARLVNEISVG